MAGFKQTLMELEPVALFSFDGEKLKDNGKQLDTDTIFDETGNSVGRLVTEHDMEILPCYHMTDGLTPIDSYDQRSIRFAPYAIYYSAGENNVSWIPKAYIIVPGVSAWDFSNYQFTYMIQGKQDWSYNIWDILEDSEERNKAGHVPSYFLSHHSVLFEHEGIIRVYQSVSRYSSDTINIELLFLLPIKKTITINARLFTDRETDLTDLLTIRFDGEVLTVYKDLRIIYSESIKLDTSRINMNATQRQLTIGGSDVSTPNNNGQKGGGYYDRTVIPTTIDNFTIFNYALGDVEIVRLVRKMFTFHELITKIKPDIYVPFDDRHSPNLQPRNLGSSRLATYIIGDLRHVEVGQVGAFALSRAIRFRNNSIEAHNSYEYRTHIMNILSDFTLFSQFKLHGSEHGALFHQAIDNSNYYGITLLVNSSNGEHKPGSVELYVGSHGYFPLGADISQDEWLELMLVKENEYFTCHFNKKKVMSEVLLPFKLPINASSNLRYAKILTHPDQQRPTDATLANLIVWDKSLTELEINSVLDYEWVYYVRGTVNLEGKPIRARVRAYNHVTGEMINSTHSDPETGAYVIHLIDNTPVDLTVIDDSDIFAKLRAYGPIQPYCRPYNTTYLSY